MENDLIQRMQHYGNQRALMINGQVWDFNALLKVSNKLINLGLFNTDKSETVYAIDVNQGIDTIGALLAVIQLKGKCMLVDPPTKQPLIQQVVQVPDTINALSTHSCAHFLLKSSGSTGKAKWLWRSENSWKNAYLIHQNQFKCHRQSGFWIDGSLSYTGNLHTLLATWWWGGWVYWTHHQTIRSAYHAVVKEQVESWLLVPSKLETLSHYMERLPDDAHQPFQIITVGEALQEKTYMRLKQIMPLVTVHMYYGSSELGHISLNTISESKWMRCHVGKPFESVEILIQSGMIYVKSPFTCFSQQDYYTSGDLGAYISGELYVHGRAGAQINRRGVKIQLDQILELVINNTSIKGAAIRIKKIKDKTTYDLLIQGTYDQSIEKGVIEQIPRPMRPSSVVYVDVLPHNENGKQQQFIYELGDESP